MMNETKRKLGQDALLFLTRGTGYFICPITHTAGHTKAFDYPDTAGHTKAFDYPVTQTRLDIPRPLITQSHRHGWTYQDL